MLHEVRQIRRETHYLLLRPFKCAGVRILIRMGNARVNFNPRLELQSGQGITELRPHPSSPLPRVQEIWLGL